MGYYMAEYFQNFSHLIKIYIQCTIQNSQTFKQFCCLQYTIMHVNGIDNKVMDCLSHYYENDTSDDNRSENTYVNMDIQG